MVCCLALHVSQAFLLADREMCRRNPLEKHLGGLAWVSSQGYERRNCSIAHTFYAESLEC